MPPRPQQRERFRKTRRPEEAAPGADANRYYDPTQAASYTKINVQTQREITSHALDLLVLDADGGGGGGAGIGGVSYAQTRGGGVGMRRGALLADVGCGSGLSGEEITRRGHAWVGVDASAAMLHRAVGISELSGGAHS